MRHDVSRISDLDPVLATLASTVHRGIAGFADQYWAPNVEVELIWTTKFVSTVQEVLDSAYPGDGVGPGYTAERLGGIAVAKNISMTEDSSHVAIVVNRNVLGTASDELTVSSIFLLAHELTHPLINRMRAASGVLDGVQFPSRTPTECARSIARTAIDEYWADRFASIVLGALASVDRDGERVPLHQGHLHGGVGGYRNQLAQVLDSHIDSDWPDLIQSYQEGYVSLDAMWGRVLMETDQVVTLLAHGQACEDGDPEGTEHLIDGTIENDPGLVHYFHPAWKRIMAAVSGLPLGSQEDFVAEDLAIADAGEAAIKAMWATLGLTFDEYDDRSFYIHVTSPTR
jgi:hypothetical protein